MSKSSQRAEIFGKFVPELPKDYPIHSFVWRYRHYSHLSESKTSFYLDDDIQLRIAHI
ncbi:MAG TPA: hypothetical protein PKD32_11250 [Saprospiraceae bacterium]|nr:hypothetical protein [Saprospiraceae bacterium]